MPVKLTEKLVSDLSLGSGITRDTEVKGLMVIANRKSKSYACQGDVWRDRQFIRTVRVTIGRVGETSLKDARNRARQVMAQIQSGIDPTAVNRKEPEPRGTTLAEAADRMLKKREKELSPFTIKWYRSHLSRGLSPLANREMATITRTEVAKLHDRLTEERGPYDANGAMRTLSSVWSDAARFEDLPPNPVKTGVRLNPEKARDWALGAEDLAGWWGKILAVENPVKREAHIALMLTGLRSNSLKGVKWSDVDDHGVLYVRQVKGGKQFKLPLPSVLLDRLRALRAEVTALDSPFIFPSVRSDTGHVMDLRLTGLPSPHAYRHTARTLLLECGVDFATTCLILNHSVPHVSFNYITREKLLGHMRDAIERYAAFVADKRAR